MRASTHLRRAAAGGAIVTLGVLTGFTPALADTTNDYVALGDSYSSGTGGGNYVLDGTSCFRSPHSFAGQLAAEKGLNLDLQACAGAVTGDLTKQYPALSSGTDYVTLTIGGNDIGFAPVVTECAKPSWWGDCTKAVNEAVAKINNVLPAKLASAYAQVKAKAPNAKIVIAGYPRLFNGRDCSWATFFSGDEMTRMNAAADLLNARTQQAVAAARLTYVDVGRQFAGHAVCDTRPYVHNLSLNIVESFHPNKAGYAAYADAIGPKLGTPRASLASVAYAGGQAVMTDSRSHKSVRAHVGGRTAGDTGMSRADKPDLRCAEARAAARKAGISDRELEELATGQDKALRGAQLSRAEATALQRAKG